MIPITPEATGQSSSGRYFASGYVSTGYVVESVTQAHSVEFQHSAAGTIQFEHGFQYPKYQFNFFQPKEETASGFPMYFEPIMVQAPFETVWPRMTDAELEALRTYMFRALPLFDVFTLAMIGRNITHQVRFAKRQIKVEHVKPGINKVTLQLVRV